MSNIVDDKNLRIVRLELGPYGTNTYILVCKATGESLVVDAPARAPTIIKGLQGTQPRYVLLTHDHYDHTGAMADLRLRLQVPLGAHAEDSHSLKSPPEIFLKDNHVISLGNIRIEVMHAPGLTPGSLCFLAGKYLLAGDTIFPGGPGKTWSPDDFRRIIESITTRIFRLPGDTRIFPGHGDGTTVKQSKEQYEGFAARPPPADLYGDVLWASS